MVMGHSICVMGIFSKHVSFAYMLTLKGNYNRENSK